MKIDTWATVGSCAANRQERIRRGGVGVGGVMLRPMQANPTIIEDNCFIGARSEVVEGVIVEEKALLVLRDGRVHRPESTKIYDRAKRRDHLWAGVPAGSVVIVENHGSLRRDGGRSLYCAVVVKRVDAKTDRKTGASTLSCCAPNCENMFRDTQIS